MALTNGDRNGSGLRMNHHNLAMCIRDLKIEINLLWDLFYSTRSGRKFIKKLEKKGYRLKKVI